MAQDRTEKTLQVQDMVHMPVRPEGARGCSVIVVSYRTGPVLIHFCDGLRRTACTN